jgi:hypothetical protein
MKRKNSVLSKIQTSYNEEFEFISQEFELARQSNIYKVYQTDAIAVKFKPIIDLIFKYSNGYF